MMKPTETANAENGPPPAGETGWVYLFTANNRLVTWGRGDEALELLPAFLLDGADPARAAAAHVGERLGLEVKCRRVFGGAHPETGGPEHVFFALVAPEDEPRLGPGVDLQPLEALYHLSSEVPERLPPALNRHLPGLHRHAIEIPYLNFKKHDFVYKFRTDRERNLDIYNADPTARGLYQSRLCEAIKETRRIKENASADPAPLDFGPVQYLLPSHFGFCLGVQNAIERAYETLAAHPNDRVFMLSELIHNPYVNADLKRRGLKYLQTDKGEPVINPESGRPYWEELTADDIVVIPAFGATNEDKQRLIEKGLPLNQYDATCMLVEKVWKAAKRFGESGYSVIIHGKSEHEETKATFSNSARHAPSLVVRNLEEIRRLGEVILEDDPERKAALFEGAGFPHTPGFHPVRDLERIAVVNQTTLLRNETLAIIQYLESVMARKFGQDRVREHVNGRSRGDTLCYATQVNQDALQKALAGPLDAAIVAGGKNSSNTFQLFRMCEEVLGDRAHYIQSEENILAMDRIRHYVFPYDPADPRQGREVERPFLDPAAGAERPVRILITGGASCPDGIIQQIIDRINGFFPAGAMKPIEQVIAELREE